MSLKVIGAGFGRTGTMSLKLALEQLGFDKCYHMMEVQPEHRAVWSKAHRGESVDLDALFDGFQATVDWPSCNLWQDQLKHFPDAKVILSLRDPESWYKSVMSTIYPTCVKAASSDDENMKAFGQWAFEIVWNPIFDGRLDDKDRVIDTFNRHNEAVKATCPADKLLVFEAKDGWAPLCEFLGCAIPETDYPRSNSTEEFNAGGGARKT